MILTPVLYNGSIELVVEIIPSSFYEEVSGASGTTGGSVTVTVNGVTPDSVVWTTDNADLDATTPTSTTTTFDYSGLTSILDSQVAIFEVIATYNGNTATEYFSAFVTRTS